MRAISSPEVTVLPSPLTISANTPDDGAGTSSTTLSVSISMRISSASTAAPGCFFQVNRVASDTDSDNWGTTTSVIAMVMNSVR
ncbi:dihydrolipoyllysine-residue succinyltransferase, E2 component [Bordetella holmesii 44057]|nr:dihydrolipoyllysine-residue succinyltransferase, E2 component [Bordetella holmesii 44057]